MPKDYTPAVRRIQTPPKQTRRADDPQALAELEQILTDELAPATPIAAMLARDLVQLEIDIVKLRQARRDIEAQALAEQVRSAFERSNHDRVFFTASRSLTNSSQTYWAHGATSTAATPSS